MWSGSQEPYDGQHYHLGRTLNVPQSIQRPHPPILIGGGGEKKTLRLVAQYAQACNLFGGPDLAHKLDVLKGHCDDVGRDYAEIEKTVMMRLDPGADGENVDDVLEQLRAVGELGVQHVHTGVPMAADLTRIAVYKEQIIPAAAAL